jgi:hypothetical protein
MWGCNPCKIPMEAKMKLSKERTRPQVDATYYRSLVGSLRYLVNTRPDLSFSVGYVSRFMQEPHEDHLMVVKHILRYVACSIQEEAVKIMFLWVTTIVIGLGMLTAGKVPVV